MKRLKVQSEHGSVSVVFRPRADYTFMAYVWVIIVSMNLLLNYNHGGTELIRLSIVSAAVVLVLVPLLSFFNVEVLNFTPDVLMYRSGPFGFSQTTTYQMRAVQGLRFAPPKWSWLRKPSGLAFDC